MWVEAEEVELKRGASYGRGHATGLTSRAARGHSSCPSLGQSVHWWCDSTQVVEAARLLPGGCAALRSRPILRDNLCPPPGPAAQMSLVMPRASSHTALALSSPIFPLRHPPFCLVSDIPLPWTLAHLGGISFLTDPAEWSSCPDDEPTEKLMRGARGTPDASVRTVGARLIRVVARTDMVGYARRSGWDAMLRRLEDTLARRSRPGPIGAAGKTPLPL